MAIVVDGTGEGARRTANLPSATLITAMGWFYFASDRDNYTCFINVSTTGLTSTNWMGTGSDGTTLIAFAQGIGQDNGSTLTPGNWYHLTLRVAGTAAGDLDVLLNGVVDATLAGSSFTPTILDFGNDESDEWADCRMAALKVWDAALTDAEVVLEMQTIRPRRLANLNLWAPCNPGATERLADYGPNGRNLTARGTLTDGAGPPIPWGITPPVIGVPGGGETIDVPSASLALTRLVPSVVAPETVPVPVASLGLTGYSPTIEYAISSSPVALEFTTYTPTILAAQLVNVPAAELRLSVYTPGVVAPNLIDVPTGALRITPLVPTLIDDELVDVPTASLELSTHPPAIDTGGGVTVQPPARSLEFTRYTPTAVAPETVAVPGATLRFTRYTPRLLAPDIVVPSAALALTQYTPVALAPRTIDAPTAGLRLTQFEPTISSSGDAVISVPTAELRLTPYVPALLGTHLGPPSSNIISVVPRNWIVEL